MKAKLVSLQKETVNFKSDEVMESLEYSIEELQTYLASVFIELKPVLNRERLTTVFKTLVDRYEGSQNLLYEEDMANLSHESVLSSYRSSSLIHGTFSDEAPETVAINKLLTSINTLILQVILMIAYSKKQDNIEIGKHILTAFGISAFGLFGISPDTSKGLISQTLSVVTDGLTPREAGHTENTTLEPILENIHRPNIGFHLFKEAMKLIDSIPDPSQKAFYKREAHVQLNNFLTNLTKPADVDASSFFEPASILMEYTYTLNQSVTSISGHPVSDISFIFQFSTTLSFLFDLLTKLPEAELTRTKETFVSLFKGVDTLLSQTEDIYESQLKPWSDLYAEGSPLFQKVRAQNVILDCIQPQRMELLLEDYCRFSKTAVSSQYSLFDSFKKINGFIHWFSSDGGPSANLRKQDSIEQLGDLSDMVNRIQFRCSGSLLSSSFPQILLFFKLYSHALSFRYYYDPNLLSDLLDQSDRLVPTEKETEQSPLQKLFIRLLKDQFVYYFDMNYFGNQSCDQTNFEEWMHNSLNDPQFLKHRFALGQKSDNDTVHTIIPFSEPSKERTTSKDSASSLPSVSAQTSEASSYNTPPSLSSLEFPIASRDLNTTTVTEKNHSPSFDTGSMTDPSILLARMPSEDTTEKDSHSSSGTDRSQRLSLISRLSKMDPSEDGVAAYLIREINMRRRIHSEPSSPTNEDL